jgi:hypothetical protein
MKKSFYIITFLSWILFSCIPPISDSSDPAGSVVNFELVITWVDAPIQNTLVQVMLYPKTGNTLTLINENRTSGCTIKKAVPAGVWMFVVQVFDESGSGERDTSPVH